MNEVLCGRGRSRLDFNPQHGSWLKGPFVGFFCRTGSISLFCMRLAGSACLDNLFGCRVLRLGLLTFDSFSEVLQGEHLWALAWTSELWATGRFLQMPKVGGPLLGSYAPYEHSGLPNTHQCHPGLNRSAIFCRARWCGAWCPSQQDSIYSATPLWWPSSFRKDRLSVAWGLRLWRQATLVATLMSSGT